MYETDIVPLLCVFLFFYEFCRYEGLKGKTSMRSYILGHTCDNNVIIGDYMINKDMIYPSIYMGMAAVDVTVMNDTFTISLPRSLSKKKKHPNVQSGE